MFDTHRSVRISNILSMLLMEQPESMGGIPDPDLRGPYLLFGGRKRLAASAGVRWASAHRSASLGPNPASRHSEAICGSKTHWVSSQTKASAKENPRYLHAS